jgi:tetratricopeptide (TPR) repeat protein
MSTLADAMALASHYYASGDSAQAEVHCWSVLSVESSHPEALRMLGLIARQRGELSQARDYLNRSLICDRGNPDTWKNLGDVYLVAGNAHASIANYAQALLLRPDFVGASLHLGIAWQELGEWEKAAACFRQVVSIEPCCGQAHNNLGNALKGQGRLAEACCAYEEALRLLPDSTQVLYNLGIVLHEQGKLDQAVDCYRRALRLKPTYADASNGLANALKEQGLLEDAVLQLRETLRHHPDDVLAYYNLSELAAEGHCRFTPEELKQIEALPDARNRSAFERSLCCFTQASVLNKQGCYDQAFGYYRQANDLVNSLLREANKAFNFQAYQEHVQRVKEAFDEAYFQRVRGWGLDTEMPVFIVGMPRSGSTLVEQILASHPKVFGAGEMGRVHHVTDQSRAAAHGKLDSIPLLPNRLAAQELAVDYLERLADVGQSAARVCNKTLESYLDLGLIATLFPRARIIHCRRNPLDVCLSCYFHNFKEIDFACSLEDLGAYYCSYEMLMAHWCRVLPVPIHEVRYEALVINQEAVTRRLLAFCGLEWDERCLDFFSTRRVVRTSSSVQVRRPMFSQAVDRWKNYRSHLHPLLKALGRPADEERENSMSYGVALLPAPVGVGSFSADVLGR